MTSIVWFRQDLRLTDNPALTWAAARGPVIGLYVLDETDWPTGRKLGGASRWWLHHSLTALAKDLGGLALLRGDPLDVVPQFVRESGAHSIAWNRCYEPYAVARDTKLKEQLREDGIDAQSMAGSLLFEPWLAKTSEGGPFKVFSPFWRACQKLKVDDVMPAPPITIAPCDVPGDRLEDWGLLPTKPNWAAQFDDVWHPGEGGATRQLNDFIATGLGHYAEQRDRPDLERVSRLSPHLHFGEISPRQVWHAATMYAEAHPEMQRNVDKFLSEIGWREFSYNLLYHFPTLPAQNLRSQFDAYPWADNPAHLDAWHAGQTGYPLVDAGMRELWSTGYLHNRVRMIVASFLTKHLRIDWRQGEAWFWDTLVDADLANNVASWQWVAGSGADAAPYFRIFNPVTQGRKFDPNGDYVRRWCPELARLPKSVIHAPFEASQAVLDEAGVVLGDTYPRPIVDHAEARAAALAGYEVVKAANT